MKKLMLIALIAVTSSAFAAKKVAKGKPQAPMKRGQKTEVCGEAGQTITHAISKMKQELAKPKVKSHTAKNLTITRPFVIASAPIVHSEKRKRQTAEVYVACVKVKKT